MTILARLESWKEQGAISQEQYALLSSLSRGEPFSLFLELNLLLYAGVLAFVAGLGWTVATWSQQLGDVVVLTILSASLAACFWYCFSHASAKLRLSVLPVVVRGRLSTKVKHRGDLVGSSNSRQATRKSAFLQQDTLLFCKNA